MSIEVHTELTEEMLCEIAALDKVIFARHFSKEKIAGETIHRNNLLILLYRMDEVLVGYKIGYELTTGTFLSWIGGVHPDFRRRGVASELMMRQHQLAAQWGYQCVRTHSLNRHRPMLLLNIRFDFDIVGIQHNIEEDELKIILEKKLQPI